MPEFALTLERSGPQQAPGDAEAHLTVGPFRARLELAGVDRAERPGLLVALKGTLYGLGLGGVLDLYARYGDAFADHLEGSFALLLLDRHAGRVLVVTDRVGSHRVYAARDRERVHLSTRLDRPEFTGRPLSPAGLGCYLASGTMLNGLTPYEGVRALERARVHEVTAAGVEGRTYWPLNFAGQPGKGEAADHEAELAETLRAAVRRRAEAAGDRLFVSLSGGYDSRGLLSLLREGGREVQTFSYTQGPPAPGSDADAAARLAAQYGAPYRALTAYRGDLLAALRRNASWGQGVAPFCDETDAWAELGTQEPSDIFVGEQAFEWSPQPAPDRQELLRRLHLADFTGLAWLAGRWPGDTFELLRQPWEAELDGLLRRASGWANPEHGEIELFFDQYLPHVLLSWREHYAGRVARVHTPYLDRDLLNLIQRTPLNLLRRKALFKRTLRQMDPALFRVPMARTMGYEPDWADVLIRERGRLWEEVEGQGSRIDEVVDPALLRSLLFGLTRPGPARVLRGQVRQRLGEIRYSPLGTALLGPPRNRTPHVDAATFLLRVLTLREVDLARTPAAQSGVPTTPPAQLS